MKRVNEKWLEIIIYILLAMVLIGLSVCLIILTNGPDMPFMTTPYFIIFSNSPLIAVKDFNYR